jgi:hypothetical protein
MRSKLPAETFAKIAFRGTNKVYRTPGRLCYRGAAGTSSSKDSETEETRQLVGHRYPVGSDVSHLLVVSSCDA